MPPASELLGEVPEEWFWMLFGMLQPDHTGGCELFVLPESKRKDLPSG